MKSFILTSLTAWAFSTVQPVPAPLLPRADACQSAVTLTGNAFASHNLTASPYDAISVISTIDAYIKTVQSRDCGAGASGGELPVGSIARYQAEYIDPIRDIILANPNTAIALIIEPDSLPNMVTHLDLDACTAAEQGYKDGIVYALAQFNLPNVVMYIDAGNGGWLGWVEHLAPGAKLIADIWKAGGSPSQVQGIATNVAGWNQFSQNPGEFENAADAQWNPAQDEKRYINQMGAELAANGATNHAIMDTSRNGVTGLCTNWGDWCNVKGAGYGALPTSDTGDSLTDAFVWVKYGGQSDGVSDPSAPGYASTCGLPDAFTPSPQARQWNQAYFEDLLINAIAIPVDEPAEESFFTPPPGGGLDSSQWCAVKDDDDPESIWGAFSDAGAALEYALEYNGTNISGVGVNNCANIASGNACNAPTICPPNGDYLPYYYIQLAFSKFHDYLNQMLTGLVIGTILSENDIQNLIHDFSLALKVDAQAGSNPLATVGSLFSLVGSIATVTPGGEGIGGAAGIFGGAVTFLSSLSAPAAAVDTATFINNASGILHDRSSKAMESSLNALSEMGSAVFNSGDLSGMGLAAFDFDPTNQENYGYKYQLSKLFADGKYVKPLTNFTPIWTSITKNLKLSLINTVLLSSNAYILKDPYNLDDCQGGGGERVEVGGVYSCYTIEVPGVGLAKNKALSWKRADLSNPLSTDQIGLMRDKYGLFFDNIVVSSSLCQQHSKGYGGEYNFGKTAQDADSIYPLCFFALPVLQVSEYKVAAPLGSTPCALTEKYTGKDKESGSVGIDYLPDNLNDVFSATGFCNCFRAACKT